MMHTWACLVAGGNNHSILVFAQETVIMEVNIVEGKFRVNKLSWLKVTGVNCCFFEGGVIFAV